MLPICLLDLKDDAIAERVLGIQRLAYRIEADLIGFDGIPPLHETLPELQQSDETFIGYFVDDVLAGVLSYAIEENVMDISRLAIHPDYFRRGIARKLIQEVQSFHDTERVIVSTGALNTPARQLYESAGYQLIDEISPVEGLIIARYEKWLK